MFRRPQNFVASCKEPFANDRLGRKSDIIELVEMIRGADTPLVLTLSAPWGYGKSSFVKMWKAFLESYDGDSHYCIYFDAWENDFSKEPLVGCMGEIGEFIDANKSLAPWYQSAVENFGKIVDRLPSLLKAAAGISSFIGLAVPVVGTASTSLNCGADAVERVKDYVRKGHSDVKDNLRNFKDNFSDLVKVVTNNGSSPIYFFIDELDRCEPEYAIKLLESIKHFFDVENVVFVLSVDRDRLGSMARVRYGDSFDASGYLSRFVDVEYVIKDPCRELFIDYIARDLLLIDKIENLDNGDFINIVEMCLDLADSFNASARDVYRAMIKMYPFLLMRHNISDSGVIVKDNMSYKYSDVSICCCEYVSKNFSNFYHMYIMLSFIREVDRELFDCLPYGFGDKKYKILYGKKGKSNFSIIIRAMFTTNYSSAKSKVEDFSRCSNWKSLLHIIGAALSNDVDRAKFINFYKNSLESYQFPID